MTPQQRAAAERLADELQQFDGTERESLRDDVSALLRELAAEPAQEATPDDMRVYDAIAANYAAEPVAYVDPRQLARGCASLHCITRPEYRSYTDVEAGFHYTPVYLHPPQQRKPLSDAQIMKLANENTDKLQGGGELFHFDLFARAIERAITGEPT